ncbi:MAG: chorismate mutase [Lachnospiraceae bacterium]|nr:chorismate mutase [Lachnospiraceae bacterium]
MRNIDELRKEIDRIDSELVRLFEERMNIALEIAAYKKQNGLPILDEGREKAVIEKCVSRLSDHSLDPLLTKWVVYTMGLSKERQNSK